MSSDLAKVINNSSELIRLARGTLEIDYESFQKKRSNWSVTIDCEKQQYYW